MKKAVVFFLILFLTLNVKSQPLPVISKLTVIIDTDCAIDDMRAISMMLSLPEISIKAVLLSDGSLTPFEGSEKVYSLLNEFNRKDITVAGSDLLLGVKPPWREFNSLISWGTTNGKHIDGKKAIDCLTLTLNNSIDKITLVCLGPLTTVGKLVTKHPELLTKIDRVVWYNESVKPLKGFNYECDKGSADAVFKSTLRIDVISNLNNDDALFDTSMYRTCKISSTVLASTLFNVHNQPRVLEKLNQKHFRLCDELVVLYLTNPELFGINPLMDRLNVRYNTDYDLQGLREAISDMITGIYVSEHNVVFNRFPVRRDMFNYDVRPLVDSAIALYGPDEWKANVMTDEFHGHLGVFSIVGAKMGIRARELFGVGTDMLDVTTYAGQRPPYSCLTDGIQVSTGATLGMGTIHLAADSICRPEAVFSYRGRSIRITLKNEYLKKVDSDINEGILKFGLMDEGYWKLIRRNALKYWLAWDRNKIFNIVELPGK